MTLSIKRHHLVDETSHRQMGRFFMCATHGAILGGGSPLLAVTTGTSSRRQGRHREVGSEGSPRQKSVPTHRNRIEGRHGGVTWHWTGTPDSRSDTRAGKSGGSRRKESCLTVGDLAIRRFARQPPRATVRAGCRGVSRGHSSLHAATPFRRAITDEGPNRTHKEQSAVSR